MNDCSSQATKPDENQVVGSGKDLKLHSNCAIAGQARNRTKTE